MWAMSAASLTTVIMEACNILFIKVQSIKTDLFIQRINLFGGE